jgi:hypothetical protein
LGGEEVRGNQGPGRSHVPPNLPSQTSLHRLLVSGSSVLQAKWHGDIAVSSIWGDEGRLDLIRLVERDLVIALIGIQEGQQVTTGYGIDHLVDAR